MNFKIINSVLFSLMQAAIIVISPQMYKVKKKNRQVCFYPAQRYLSANSITWFTLMQSFLDPG